LLDHNVLADDEAMRRHLSELGKNARDVLVGIDKGNHNRQIASCLNQMGGLDAASALETRDRVEGYGAGCAVVIRARLPTRWAERPRNWGRWRWPPIRALEMPCLLRRSAVMEA
jgi:hypothetical protein